MLSVHSIGIGTLSVALALLAGCSTVSDVTREAVTRSETNVLQAQQTVGNSESGALELQSAHDNIAQAKQALEKGDGKKAERYSQQAQLDAELAVAKSQSGAARKAADELLASIKTLRQESQRTSTPR